jgi:hypothetical protein
MLSIFMIILCVCVCACLHASVYSFWPLITVVYFICDNILSVCSVLVVMMVMKYGAVPLSCADYLV